MRTPKWNRTLPSLMLSMLLCGPLCAAQQENSDDKKKEEQNQAEGDETKTGDGKSVNRKPVPEVDPTPEATDEQIQERLQKILESTKWFEGPKVRVEEGIVYLSGGTENPDHKNWASELAMKTQNVVAVVNEIDADGVVDADQSWQVILASLTSMWEEFLSHLPLLVVGVLVLILTWVAVRILRKVILNITERSAMQPSLRDLLLQLTSIAAWLVGWLIAAVIVFPGMTPAKLLTVLGLGSVAIGFAFKDIFENFFAGVLILWRFPFDKGDFIECQEIGGKVEDITIRNTLIRQVDGQLVVVPNGFLFKNPVSVLTNWASRRVTVICGVGYGEDVNASREAITTAVQSCESIDKDREVEIFAQEFGDSSVNFEVTWWTGNTPMDIRKSRDEVVAAVKQKLDDVQIEIPFPYRTLTFKESLPIVSQETRNA